MDHYTQEELIFGLDIGTRTVIGTVGYKENNQFIILGCESVEHEERAMSDGQIHDIQKVSRAVCKVKTILEQKLGITLTDVAIAAAGRALNTQIVSVDTAYDEIQEFTSADVHNLELYGVEKAKEGQQKLHSDTEYFCVAYSVINYFLDGYIITNLEGHKGTSIGAKMIATFLPKLVIDSLYAVTERADLNVVHLTLEPIAAINAIIPENLRLLNLALVDIGAGTSDIAITKEGSVVAYGMIPIAGDEVTEVIVHKYLVDFNTAEKIKQQLTVSESVSFEDILGLSHKVTKSEVWEVIKPTIEHLTKNIADKIFELNGQSAPNAVFCVGGGSQMLAVTENLAEFLKLAPERVAVRSAQNVVNITDHAGVTNGPEMITPLGICITSMQSKYSQFTTISLNQTKIKLLNAKKLTVLDAIVAAGIEHTEIFPNKGKTLMFKLNGERIRIKGENSIPADILLNGHKATLNDVISDQDEIQIEKAIRGKDASALLADYVESTFEILVNGEKMALPVVFVNEDCMPLNYQIKENDDVKVIFPKCLGDLLEVLYIDYKEKIVMVNFNCEELHYQLKNGDSILIDDMPGQQETKEVSKNADNLAANQKFINTATVEENVPEAAESKKQFNQEGHLMNADELYITVNGEVVALPKKDEPYMLASIFDYIAFDLTKPQGTIQLFRNGIPAALTDNLQDRDALEIYWKK